MENDQLLHEIQEQFLALDKFLQTIDGRLGNIDSRLQRMDVRLTGSHLLATLPPSTQEMIKICFLQNNGDILSVKQAIENARHCFPTIERDLETLARRNDEKAEV